MINKPISLQIDTQSQQNFTKTSSTLSMLSSVPSSPSNCDSQKLFHRKPSFKYYQRKEKKDSDPQNKICFISPQKSQIFKKYTPYRSSQTDLNSSFITNKSSEISFHQDNRKSFKSTKPAIQLQNSRSILNEINNIKTQDVFRTPKNIKNDESFLMSPSNLKRMSFNRARNQESTSLSQIRSNFDKDFESLLETKNSQYHIGRKSSVKWFQRKQSQKNIEIKQDQHISNQEVQILNMQLNILKESLDQLNIKYKSVEVQKNQLEDSSKLFLSQIKNLQVQNEKLNIQNEKLNIQKEKLNIQIEKSQSEIYKLNILLTQKNTKISQLQTNLVSLQKTQRMFEEKIHQQQINQNYKALYFETNEKLKYLDVENSILKKFLEQKKQDQKKFQKIQIMNKKLTSKNKFLIKQIEQLQQELQNLQFDGKSKKTKCNNNKDRSDSKNNHSYDQSLKSVKTPSFILQKTSKSPKNIEKTQRHADSIFQNQIVSSGSLQFSFELSPQKSYSPKLNEEKQEFEFRTPHKCFN